MIHQRWRLAGKPNANFPLKKGHFMKMKIFDSVKKKGKKKVQINKKKPGTNQNNASSQRIGNALPPAPKRPMSSYFIFANEVRAQVRMQNPSLTNVEVVKEISKMYQKLSSDEKKKYQGKASRLMEEYQKEKVKYEEKYGSIKNKRKETSKSGEQENPQLKKRKTTNPQIRG